MIPPTTRSVLARRHWRGDTTVADRPPCGRVRHRPDLMRACPVGLMSDRAAARIAGVSRAMLGLWVETGAWPLPRAILATTQYFRQSEVEDWLKTGIWPAEACFQGRSRVWPVKT